MTRLRIATLAVTLTLLAAIALPAGVAGGQGGRTIATAIQFDGATKTSVEGQLALNATLRTADGKAVNEREVDFYQEIDFMGGREIYLGSSLTDSTGSAAIAYQPSQEGRQTIKVYFVGDTDLAAVGAAGSIDVTAVVPPFETERLPLGPVRLWLPSILVLLVLGTWAALFAVLVGTVRGVRAASSSSGRGSRPMASAAGQRR